MKKLTGDKFSAIVNKYSGTIIRNSDNLKIGDILDDGMLHLKFKLSFDLDDLIELQGLYEDVLDMIDE